MSCPAGPDIRHCMRSTPGFGLTSLARNTGKAVDLGSVPGAEWDAIARFGFDAVWFMGVWERSPAGIAIANQNMSLVADFRRALPDFPRKTMSDLPIAYDAMWWTNTWEAREGLGGRPARTGQTRDEAAAGFRSQPCCAGSPVGPRAQRVFIQGSSEDASRNPCSYIEVQGNVFACGRDPYFPAWPDVLQLNAFAPGLRQAPGKRSPALPRNAMESAVTWRC